VKEDGRAPHSMTRKDGRRQTRALTAPRAKTAYCFAKTLAHTAGGRDVVAENVGVGVNICARAALANINLYSEDARLLRHRIASSLATSSSTTP